MPTGKIKYYNQDKGYGFIAQDEGEDLFFHISKSPSVGEINVGQRVEYEITKGKKGAEAEDIQLILTPFEQQKLRQGKVVVSKDTLVWTPTTDVRFGTRQSEQQSPAGSKRSTARRAPPKSGSRDVKKSSPISEDKDLSKKKAAPPKKPAIKKEPSIAEKKTTEEEIKQKVKPQEPAAEKTEEEPTKREKSKQKPQRKRRLTYGDRYMLKQIRENTPMVFEMYNHESISCQVAKLFKYDLELIVDGGEKIRIQKHNIKYCYKRENAESAKASINLDEDIRSQGLTPIIPRKKRYQVDRNLVKEAWVKKLKVRLVTREGEIIMGPLDWFSLYEVKVRLPFGGNVVAFFHALYGFKVLSGEAASQSKEMDSIPAVVERQADDSDSVALEEVSTKSDSVGEVSLDGRIRAARKALAMSQKDLAELFGVSAQTIGNWERGKNQPQAKYREQIEQLFATAESDGN
jgi:cold shock CspA family protein/DNA-binding XRE family transcriptional regulator